MIPKTFIELIEDKTDFVALVNGYVKLSPRGGDLVGLCPFENGTKSTFAVSPDKKIWKCFKCGKGGSVVKFVMAIEKLSFPEAIHFLADKLELEVPQDKKDV